MLCLWFACLTSQVPSFLAYGQGYLSVRISHRVVLEELSWHIDPDQKAGQVGPFLELRGPLKEPMQDWVNDRLASCN